MVKAKLNQPFHDFIKGHLTVAVFMSQHSGTLHLLPKSTKKIFKAPSCLYF